MPSKWAWIIFNLVVYAAASLENDTTKAFIELTEFAYEDICSNTAEAEWAFINSPSNKTLSTWVSSMQNKSNILLLLPIQKDTLNTHVYLYSK